MKICDNLLKGKSGLWLFEYADDIFLAFIEIPERTASMAKWEQWNNSNIINALPFCSRFPPQTVLINSIEYACYIGDLIAPLIKEYKLTADDVIVPFIGGIGNFDWREMIKRFYELGNKGKYNLWDFRRCYEEYLREVFQSYKETP